MKDSKPRRCIKANIAVVILIHLLNSPMGLSANTVSKCDVNVSEESTNEFTKQLFTRCLMKSVYSIVIISNQSNFECSLWQSRVSKPYYLLDFGGLMSFKSYSFEAKHLYDSKKASEWSYKRFFVFEDMNSINIEPIFKKLKNSHLWNSESIFIIKITKIYGSCNLAADLFRIIWRVNAVNGYFICHHPQYGTILYTFNPFSSFAPEPWIRVETHIQQNGHPFTIFMNYDRKGICKSLFWEKAKNLSNFPVKLANITYGRYISDNNDGPGQEASDIIYEMNNIVWSRLGARVISEKFSSDDLGEIDGESGKASETTALVLQGEYECLLFVDYERGLWRNEVNLFTVTGVCFVTRKVFPSILERIFEAFPLYTWLNFLLLFVFTTILLTYLLKASYQDVAIDVLSITVGQSIIQPIKTDPSKVTVIYILFVFTIINTYLQSKLEMLLTVEPSHREFKTLSSLVDNGYEVCTTSYYWQYYSNTPYRYRLTIESSFESCLELMKNNNKLAFLDDCYDVKYGVQKRVDLKLHKDHTNLYNVQLFRDDSVLKSQFQKLYAKLYESGVDDFLFDLSDSGYRIPRYSQFQALSIDHLRFAFIFLLISQIICCVVFLFDIFRLYERSIFNISLA